MARPRKNPEFITKTCEGCKKQFTISFRKYRQRFCNKSCAQNTPSVQEKIKKSQLETYQKNYGVDHPMKTEKVVNNFKKSMIEKYGVSCALKKEEFLNKSKLSKKEKYGNENYNNEEQRKQTCLEKYGVDNIRKCKIVNDKLKFTIIKKHFTLLESFCKTKNIQPLFSLEEYKGYHFKNKYKFKCNICNKQFETDVYKPTHIFCEICNPLDNKTLENELFKYISSIIPDNVTIKRNDRTVLFGKELDIYIPFKKLAFELNGLYWHSENGRKIGKFYHLNKLKSCIDHGINLIHIFENEWNYKKDIVKSVIKNLFGYTSEKIYARDCIINNVNEHDKNEFLTKNHLQGKDNSSIRYGLYYKNELVSIMTFCKSRFDKKIQYEMYRYCNKLNTSIVGGASKLFSHFKKEYSPESIVSYNDRRYFDGMVYKQLGFEFIKNTSPNYWYIDKDYKSLFNRIGFQKHKLKKLLTTFNPDLTEWENMKMNGFDRIWDCGNGKWVWKK
jgi:hypothetical protein